MSIRVIAGFRDWIAKHSDHYIMVDTLDDVRRAKQQADSLSIKLGEVTRAKDEQVRAINEQHNDVEHLRAAGVPVTVINGITAGLAGLTSLGVPLTHREHAHGVVFVTGHAKPGDDGTDWRALAATARDARLTLVIYMGVSGARRIREPNFSAQTGASFEEAFSELSRLVRDGLRRRTADR